MQDQRYEDDCVSISVALNPHPDRFSLSFDKDRRCVTVKRLDATHGWGQDLSLVLLDKASGRRRVLKVGPSSFNSVEVSVEEGLDLEASFRMPFSDFERVLPERRKAYIAIATIPSRAGSESFLSNLRSLASEQTLPADGVFVTVSDNYRRLGGRGVSEADLGRIRSVPGVEVITMEDMGPASKYLGPLIYKRDQIKGSLLIVADDDRMYSRNLVRNFSAGMRLFPRMRFAAGDGLLYFRQDYMSMSENYVRFEVRRNNHGFAGFFGFCLKVEGMDDIVQFHQEMLGSVKGAFYHDDGMIRSYANFKGEDMLMLTHRGPDVISKEPPDALCQNTPINRNHVESEMFRLAATPGFLKNTISQL
jgi:hypothetical protein